MSEETGLELPVLSRTPTAEEIGALLGDATRRPTGDLTKEDIIWTEKFVELLASNQRFHSLLMMQTLLLSTENGMPLLVKVAAMLETALFWGARLGVLMERRDREGEREKGEVEEGLRGVEEATRREEEGGIRG